MKKLPDANPLRERFVEFARAITPRWQERALVGAILLSMLAGSIVMHLRREYRLHHPAAASPSPRSGTESSGGG
jgi:hypothetical protein